MDLDNEILKPLDPLFRENRSVFLVESVNFGGVITNSILASKPGQKFWLDLIEEMKKPPSVFWFGKHFKVMNTTGPLMLTRVYNRGDYDIGLMPQNLVLPCTVCELPCQKTDGLIRNLPGFSWNSYDSKVYNFIFCNWQTIMIIFLFLVLVMIMIINNSPTLSLKFS